MTWALLLLLAADCFTIQDLRRADDEHYWSRWSASRCQDRAVYVMVEFSHLGVSMGHGVWVVYNPAGEHVNRWTSRVSLPEGATVTVRKVTRDSEEALKW